MLLDFSVVFSSADKAVCLGGLTISILSIWVRSKSSITGFDGSFSKTDPAISRLPSYPTLVGSRKGPPLPFNRNQSTLNIPRPDWVGNQQQLTHFTRRLIFDFFSPRRADHHGRSTGGTLGAVPHSTKDKANDPKPGRKGAERRFVPSSPESGAEPTFLSNFFFCLLLLACPRGAAGQGWPVLLLLGTGREEQAAAQSHARAKPKGRGGTKGGGSLSP